MTHQAAVPRYPGLPAIVDGSDAVAHVETRLSDVACVRPITPSTAMAGLFQAAVAAGATNLWGTPLRFVESESEHASASAAERAALAGDRVTTFTAGRGLVRMKEVMYVIAGRRLPAVFHVGARAVASQALDIHTGHDDVMAVADTGWGILFARNAQEAADLAAIARRVAEATDIPFMVVQDGFLTTHTLENVALPEDDLLREFVGGPHGGPHDRVSDGLDPAETLARAMTDWTVLTGRRSALVDAYRCADATEILVAMGTIADTAIAVVDHLRSRGRPVGCVAVTSFRPFPAGELARVLHRARSIGVVERTDEPLAAANPLTREIQAALYVAAAEGVLVPRVLSFSAGLGARDVAAGDLVAVFDRLAHHDADPVRHTVLGIDHPQALERVPIDLRPAGAWSLRGYPAGGFGSATTHKLVATLAAELFGKVVQACPRYGSATQDLPTTYDLTIADGPIRLHAGLDEIEFVLLPDVEAFALGDPLAGLSDGGAIFVQSPLTDPAAIWASIPAAVRADLVSRRIRLTALDTAALAAAHAPRPNMSAEMHGVALVGVFLRVAPFAALAGLDRAALMDALCHRLGRPADLAVIMAAHDGLIDVSAALDLPTGDPPDLVPTSLEPQGVAR